MLGNRGPRESNIRVTPATPRESLMALIPNTYVGYLLDSEMRRREFAALARLVATVPVRLVTAPSDPSRVAELCTRLAEDCAAPAA